MTSAISRNRAHLPLSSSLPTAVSQPLRRVVADLLEPHQERQHQALALNPLGFLKLLGQLFDRLLVEGSLLPAELAKRFHFGLVRQVRDHRFIRLQPPQNVGPHELAQWAIGIVRPVRKAFDEVSELLRRSQQPRIDEVENGPEIAEPVLDGGAGQRESCMRLQPFDGPRLLGIGVLDGLRLVHDDQMPGGFGDPWDAEERAVAGDYQVHAAQPPGRKALEFGGRKRGRMGDEGLQTGRKAFDLRCPVRQQRSRGYQQARLRLTGRLALQDEEQGKNLNSLAESHVVGQACPQAEFREEIEPAYSHLLVRPQRRVQGSAGVDSGQSFGAAEPF